MLLEGDSDPFHIQIANNLIVLKLKKEDHHWWSPEMNLRLESEEKGTMIFEVIGPNASIFTLAMFFILLGSVTFLASFIMALAQTQLGNEATLEITGTILSALLIVGTLLALARGRSKAASQVRGLRQFVQRVIDG